MKIAVAASFAPSLINFRGHLLKSIIENGHEVLAFAPSAEPQIQERLQAMGIRYIPVPLNRRGLNPAADCGYILRMVRLLKREDVEFYFSYTIKPVVFGSIAARLARVPRLSSMITGLGYAFQNEGISGKTVSLFSQTLYRRALTKHESVFFHNEEDKDLFLEKKLIRSEQAVVVNGSGVDIAHYKAAPVPSGPPVFLMIARLLRAKGVWEFLQASERLKPVYPDCIFRLVGPIEKGPDSLPFEELRRRASAGIIELPGEVKDVRPEISSATVYVLPSYREGIPRTVLEAMSTGRAIITSDTPGCRETVVDGVNGFLVPVRDSVALSCAMKRFIIEPSLAVEMGAASRRIVMQRFNVHEVNRSMLKYMRLLRQNAPVAEGL